MTYRTKPHSAITRRRDGILVKTKDEQYSFFSGLVLFLIAMDVTIAKKLGKINSPIALLFMSSQCLAGGEGEGKEKNESEVETGVGMGFFLRRSTDENGS